MKNTILKKIKSLHKKNGSNKLKNNINNNNDKLEKNDIFINYNSNNDIIIDNDDNSSDTDNNYLTIEKDNNDNYNMNMEKIRALSNNMNNINKIIRNKKEYIFIKNNKKILENKISLEKSIKNEKVININNNNNTNSNFLEKEKKGNYIDIQKLNNRIAEEFKKNFITSRKKIEKENINDKKEINKSFENEYNSKNTIKNNEDSISSLNDVKTIKDQESIDFECSFSNKKIKIEKKQKMEKKIIDLFLKNSYQDNNSKKNYNEKKLNTKKNINIRKNKNINNNRNLKIMEEEEKTIIYSKEKNDMKDLNIMNYYKILINKKNNKNKNIENNELEFKINNKNIKENLSNNIINSEKKIINPHFEFYHSNSNDLAKKLEFKIKTGKRLKGNNKKYILNKNEIKNAQKKIDLLDSKKAPKNNNIKEKITSNKNLNLFCDEEEKNKNNKKNIVKYVDNTINLIPNYKNKKKEIKKSSDFSLKMNELNHLNYKKLTLAQKKNILFINDGNNSLNDEKMKAYTNNNFNNFKKTTKIKSIEKNIKNDLSNRNNRDNIDNIDNSNLYNNNINNFDNKQFEAKKNKTYFVTNNEQKIINISSKDIHKIEEKKQIIKCNNKNKVNKKNNIKQINKSNKEKEKKEKKKSNNNNIKRNNNNINIEGAPPSENNININYINLIKNYKTNEYNIKRSISPHLNNSSLYSNFQSNKLVLMNKNQNQNNSNNKKKDFKININNEIHTEFFKNKNEENKNYNINARYSHNVNNTEAYFYLDETIEDLSRSLKKNSDCLINNNNCFTYTKGNKHISPINNQKQKRIFSSNSSKTNKMINNNINNFTSTCKFNKKSSIVLKNKNLFNKNKIKINVENILNTDFKYSINLMPNKEKEKRNNESQTLSNKKNTNKVYKNKKMKNGSYIDIQIPLIPEENNQVISLKTMKYNLCINSNENIFIKMKKIFRNAEIVKIILLFLTNNDLFNLSLVNNLCFKITKKIILENIMNNIINNINNEKLINKIWNVELIKYSKFNDMENFDNIYNNYLNISKKYDKEIIKDLLRTFPNDNSFHKGAESYNKLFNILKAYSNYNNEIGYAQGMNFIVGKLIKFFKCEKKSFIYLDSLFNKLKMENVMGIYNCLENKMKIVQYLLNKLCPNIVKFLEKKKINHGIFTASWFITLFSKSFKYDKFLLIIWSFSIIFGWKFIFLFSISVIIAFKDKYSDLDLYDFTQYMKNIFNLDYFKKKFIEIMKLTFYYISEWKNIIKDIDFDYLDEVENKKIKALLINRKKRKENILNQSNKESIYKEVEDKETDYI